MLPLHVTLSYYKRREIQDELVWAAQNKEVAIRFGDYFGKRPDTLTHAADILELAKQKATSFHCSEELWSNPLFLGNQMKPHEIADLRIGWDLVLDIDCSIFEYSRIAADIVIRALKFHEIKNVFCKFSGNKGFHIGIPFAAFPETIAGKKTSTLFPEAARRIAAYLVAFIKKPLGRKILEYEGGSFNKIVEKVNLDAKKITYYEADSIGNRVAQLDVEPFLNIDTILISSRHLYRMPYSLHEKSGLASVPLDPDKVLQFERADAMPERVKVFQTRFLDPAKVEKGEATGLLTSSLDFTIPEQEQEGIEKKKEFSIPEEAVPEELFPPCIKGILNGVKDGRKRAVFILINFLRSVGYDYDTIEQMIIEWNKKNHEPLREVIWKGQLRHHKASKKNMPPPNCNNEMYMVGIGVCKPDNLCSKIRNPASYALRKVAHKDDGRKKAKGKSVPANRSEKTSNNSPEN